MKEWREMEGIALCVYNGKDGRELDGWMCGGHMCAKLVLDSIGFGKVKTNDLTSVSVVQMKC